MIHETINALRHKLIEITNEIAVGSRWRHTLTQELYEVVGHTILEATDEVGVTYCQPSYPEVTFTRPANEWTGDVRAAGMLVRRFIQLEY